MTGKVRWSVTLGVIVAVLLGVVVVRAVTNQCRWGTFAYQVAIHKSAGQEDRRMDAAVLVEGEETIVTENHHVTDVAVSPDGKQVVVTAAIGLNGDEYTASEPTGLYIHDVDDVDGSDPRLLTKPGGYSPDWSPDGKTIAFLGGGGIATVDVDDGGTRKIYELPPSDKVDPPYLSDLTWSADSQRIAFLVGHQTGKVGAVLWTMRSDGSDLKRMWAVNGAGAIEWSPDGERFAYEGSYKGVSSLMMRDADGGKPVQVEPFGYQPHWSKDGSQLAYFIGHEGHYASRILLGDADGKKVVPVPVPKKAENSGSFSDWASC